MNLLIKKIELVTKLGEKLIQLKKQGFLIFDKRQRKTVVLIEQKGLDNEFGLCINGYVYFSENFDYYHSLANLHKLQKTFKIIDPKDIKALRL